MQPRTSLWEFGIWTGIWEFGRAKIPIPIPKLPWELGICDLDGHVEVPARRKERPVDQHRVDLGKDLICTVQKARLVLRNGALYVCVVFDQPLCRSLSPRNDC